MLGLYAITVGEQTYNIETEVKGLDEKAGKGKRDINLPAESALNFRLPSRSRYSQSSPADLDD